MKILNMRWARYAANDFLIMSWLHHETSNRMDTHFPLIKKNHQNNLLKLLINTAEKNKIPFQRLAASRSTGTDTDAFAYSGKGVASALISMPLRYMHTTVEMVHRDDVENVIKMIYETLLNIKGGETFSYFE